MRPYMKIGLSWGLLFGTALGVTISLPHRELEVIWVSAQAIDFFIAIVCFFVAINEIKYGMRVIFLSLSIFFFVTAIGWSISALIGKAFLVEENYGYFYFKQYQWAIYYFLLLLVVSLGVLEVISRGPKLFQNVLLSFIIAGAPFSYFYYPIFENPLHLYSVPDAKDFSALNQAASRLVEKGQSIRIEELKSEVKFPSLSSEHTLEEKHHRVMNLYPYLEGKNYVLLMYKPLYSSALSMSIIAVGLLLFMLLYKYKIDLPISAYLDKILVAFVPICVLEGLHSLVFLNSVNYDSFIRAFTLGTILTRLSYLILLFFITLRYFFLMSPTGYFYEQKIMTNPQHVSRWRDYLDEFIIRTFLDPNKYGRRLFHVGNIPENLPPASSMEDSKWKS